VRVGSAIASGDGEASNGEVYYLLSDHLGSTTVVADADGVGLGSVIYDPYGAVLESTLSVTVTDRLFTSQRWDATIGLYDYNARFYDPYLNRFLSPDSIIPDPANPQDLNRYTYVRNNPLGYVDPDGHNPQLPPRHDGGWVPGSAPSQDKVWSEGTATSVSWGDVSDPNQVAQLYGMLAYELGPRDEEGKTLYYSIMDPWPDTSSIEDSGFNHMQQYVYYQTAKNNALVEAYGGYDNLMLKVSEACLNDSCNNRNLDDWESASGERFSEEARSFLAGTFWAMGSSPGSTPQAFFLREINADEFNRYNYEPWWMAELMGLYPRQVLVAQGKWVLEEYLVDPESWQQWHQLNRGGWQGTRGATTDVPPPTVQ